LEKAAAEISEDVSIRAWEKPGSEIEKDKHRKQLGGHITEPKEKKGGISLGLKDYAEEKDWTLATVI